MTVSGWVKVDAADTWGGFIGCLQDNGSYEKGWVLGTREQKFSFALATKATGTMTYLADTSDFTLGEWYYLTATYNGQSMRLFVNGQLHATTTDQNGDIAYAGLASDWFGIGEYVDQDENWPHSGALDELILWARALSDTEVADLYEQASNLAPTVSITAPVNNATYIAPADITISATANDLDGNVGVVEFYSGTMKLFEDTDGAPFTFVWTNAPAGIHTITAKATDNLGAKTISQPVDAVVLVNIPPSISILSPASGTTFAEPASITFVTNANDLDGSVATVEFFNGADKIGEDVDGVPFFFNWQNVSAGTYQITARATDNNGSQTVSDTITVIVSPDVAADEPGRIQNLIVAPNPTSGLFRFLTDLDLNDAALSVYSVDNQLILQKKISSKEVDLSDLPTGAYLIEIQTARRSTLRGAVVKI
jgi:hypothetical protein